MHGRSYPCLLAISFLILTPALLRGQSARVEPEFAFPPTHIVPPVAPAPGFPRQPAPPGSPGTIGFQQIARAAGTIFSGTVTAVARHPATSRQSVETVAITFHVERVIRGATPGSDLTISQWIGLWSSGQRYRVGERVLLFLYPPSKLGLTSCVAASIGRFTIDPSGRILLSAQHLLAFRTDPILGGKSRLTFSELALAVQRVSEQTGKQE